MIATERIASAKLAVDGGPKAVTTPLPHWPAFSEEAIQSVEQVLRSGRVNYWTGSRGMEFERAFASWQGSRFGVSVATGTAALHVALATLGIGPGDEVIVPSYTFIATSFAVVQAGAVPRFADVNLDDQRIRSWDERAGEPDPAPDRRRKAVALRRAEARYVRP